MKQFRASIDDAVMWARVEPLARWVVRRSRRQMSAWARTDIATPLEHLWQAAIAGPVAAVTAHGVDVTSLGGMIHGHRESEARGDRHAVRGLLVLLAVATLVASLAVVAAAILRSRRRPAEAASYTTRPIAIPVSTTSTERADGSEDQSVVAALQAIRGIGPQTARRLHAAGVRSIEQVATWGPDDIDRVAGELGMSAARMEHEDWIGQARALGDAVRPNGRDDATTRA